VMLRRKQAPPVRRSTGWHPRSKSPTNESNYILR
jgi:hypothetical protein